MMNQHPHSHHPVHQTHHATLPSHPQSSATEELKRVLTIPPENFRPTTNNAVAVAHAALESIRDSGDVQFLFLRTILEIDHNHFQHSYHSHHQNQQQQQASTNATTTTSILAGQDEELLFHCITGARHVVLTKWNKYSTQFKNLIRDLLMTLGHNGMYSRTIRMAFYNSSASFWKRQWNEPTISTDINTTTPHSSSSSSSSPSPEEQTLIDGIMAQQQRLNIPQLVGGKDDLYRYLEHGIPGSLGVAGAATGGGGGGDVAMLSSCCMFLTVLVGEFAGKSASNYNMPLEFHKKAHSAFEQQFLDKSLDMSMKALSHTVGTINSNCSNNNNNPNMGNDKPNITDQESEVALVVVRLCSDLIGWEFGTDAWELGGYHKQKTLITPPSAWGPILVQPDFIKPMFHVHNAVVHSTRQVTSGNTNAIKLGNNLRQLLLLLSSLSGNIFQSIQEKQSYAALILDGILSLLASATTNVMKTTTNDGIVPDAAATELLDSLSMVSRMNSNFKMSTLIELPQTKSLLTGLTDLGRYLLQEHYKECQAAEGDLDSMPNFDFREEALSLLIDSIVVLCGDPWLMYTGTEESRGATNAALGVALGPLYSEFVNTRTKMARLEEVYLTANETELDEVREEIHAASSEEEMVSLALMGRLNLQASLACISSLFGTLVPQLQSLWDSQVGVVSPEAAGLLEESRLVTQYIGYLLADNSEGETPLIPDGIVEACKNNQEASGAVNAAVQTLRQFAEFQATKVSVHASDPRLSPLLGSSFLWFFCRFARTYVAPVQPSSPSTIYDLCSSSEQVQSTVNFLITLCLHYNCYWPQERQVQDNACTLLFEMAKRGKDMRVAMVASPSFHQLVSYHCLTCGVRHSASSEEFISTIKAKAGNSNINLDMIRGFQRLPYDIRAKLCTAILVACSEDDEKSKSFVNDSVQSINDSFSSLVNVLSSKQIPPDSVDAKEMTSLCVLMYGGIAKSGDMVSPDRIPTIITPQLVHLSGLMQFYAEDLSICEALLRLFRDYAEQFIIVLEPDSCIVLFQASAELLKSYSVNHCSSNRTIKASTEEEEQQYNDVVCVIELLIQLGTKDFLDAGNTAGMNSAQVTDMVFFGLQQVMPLMTRGLLQFPELSTKFFELVGYLSEIHPGKMKVIPYDFFDSLLEALLMGMSHHDVSIGKCSLQGLTGIARDHLENRTLDVHIATCQNHEGLIDKCSRRLLTEVVFQNIVWDRLETAGSALLPLASIDLTRFAAVVQGLANQLPPENQPRLMSSFQALLKTEVLNKFATAGYEGRKNRIMFKKDFETFCHSIHEFIVIK